MEDQTTAKLFIHSSVACVLSFSELSSLEQVSLFRTVLIRNARVQLWISISLVFSAKREEVLGVI